MKMNNKGLIIGLIGLIISLFSIGAMLYGIDKNPSYIAKGLILCLIGCIISSFGLISIYLKNKKNN